MMKKLLFSLLVIAISVQFMNAQTADINQYVMYFPFDNDLTDASGQNVTLNPKDAATVVSTYAPGQFGDAALFDDKPYITANSTFEAGASFSILMWVNFNSLSSATGSPKLLHQEDQGPTATFLGGRPLQIATAAATFNTSFGERVINSPSSPVVGTWTHIAVVMDKAAGTSKMYVDGVEVVVTDNSVGANIIADKTNNAQLSFGVQKNSSTVGLLDAYVDDFVITTEVLDATTISNIMANGAAAGGLLSNKDFANNAPYFEMYNSNENTVTIDSNVELDTYTIFNTLGQEVKTGALENKEINVNAISKGIYIVRVSSSDTGVTLSKKIVL